MRFAFLAFVLPLSGLALTDAEVAAVIAGFAERRDAMLERQVRDPYPGLRPQSDYQLFAWHKLDFALAALFLGREGPAANVAVREVVARGTGEKIGNGEDRFHWIAPHLCRIHGLFAADGRLEEDAAAGIRAVLRDYLAAETWHSRFQERDVWTYWGSENHDAQKVCTLWGAAKLLAADPGQAERPLPDGATPAARFAELDAYVKEQFRERVRKGLLAECASPGYSKYTLACWYNYHDFGDPELKRLAGDALTLWWADWAQEQLAGVRGGAKGRSYQGGGSRTAGGDDSLAMAWFYLGIGRARGAHPGYMCLATSSYRLPPVVVDLALDTAGRGDYEAVSRRPGLARPGTAATPHLSQLDVRSGGLVRYSFCTPDFIMGSWLLAKRPRADWTAISAQNRWQGVILAGDDPDARIYPQCEGLRNGKTYNQYWSAQRRGTMVVAKLPDRTHSHQCGDLRLYVAPKLARAAVGPWVFVEAERVWLAARFVADPERIAWDDGSWWRCRDASAPLIVEAARRQDFPDAGAFRADILARRCEIAEGKLAYEGRGGRIAFDLVGEQLPAIDGQALDLAPPFTFRSPFFEEAWNSGKVVIRKGDRQWSCDVGAGAR